MSATIISSDELAESCGVAGEDGARKFETVTVPMTFPVENRRVIVAPVADMSKKGKDNGEWEHCATAIRSICLRHPAERVLVHTVSYELARLIVDRLARTLDRPVLSYGGAAGRDGVLSRFRRSERAVLVAPSMDRGVDLADEACRVVVVAKVPFPYLGDPQVNARMHGEGGQAWYSVQTMRRLVQMLGRATRHENDWSVGYVLDRQMVSNVLKKSKGLLPKWFREGLVMDFPVRELMRGE